MLLLRLVVYVEVQLPGELSALAGILTERRVELVGTVDVATRANAIIHIVVVDRAHSVDVVYFIITEEEVRGHTFRLPPEVDLE